MDLKQQLEDDPVEWDTDNLPSHARRDRATTYTVASVLAVIMVAVLATLLRH